ncbi:hypothetical protein BC739_003533 [Kutzneria viridogrisea]|uniref:VOC domain-containing protein n=2 Tax=Kutzneria TaxID=43356 RepID=W5WIP8_9PSEU|nr:VOC family protein [Kutzneria albida]AHI01079.1 hypothetical protein KALB_7721 [Kutzneria albida DSM 43870]MBA8926334.1 hypothetical protein [Kutzneria viridogrisea]
MPEASDYAQGTPCWVDLSTPDIEASKEFYAALFGWQYEVGPPETHGYTQALLRGKTVAGLMQPPPGQDEMPPSWTTYLAAEDAEAALKSVVDNGGQPFTGVIDVRGQGKMWIAADPTGAVFGAWQSGVHRGSQLVNEPGTVIWNELSTGDGPAARDFYAKVFGLEIGAPMGGMDYTTLEVAGRPVGGIGQFPDTIPAWAVYFAVADTDAVADLADEHGATVVNSPKDTTYGRMATIQDPMGALFSLMSVAEQ